MHSGWLSNEGLIRIGVTLVLVMFFAFLEFRFPRKVRVVSRAQRWIGNGAIQAVNALLVGAFLPWLAPFTIALAVSQTDSGLLNALTLPAPMEFLLCILILDLAIYWQHRFMHRINCLWRLHRMHHADVDVDVTTALRFHPLEIILSMVFKSVLVWLLGIPVAAILVFAVLLNGMAIFNHANLLVPVKVDRLLRYLFVTPDMHRVHHSVKQYEQNSNYGFSLSCWDRWFGSYRAQPEDGHGEMVLGLNETKGQQTGSVVWMLKQPFV